MSAPPPPDLPPDIDLHGYSGFMLDVDRLLASELVAIGTPEECWAALMLWCRAWKQSPPGSLPDNDRILAAFSGTGARWPKLKGMALRGFVLCSDGRMYHHVLTKQVLSAWQKRKAYRSDQERLKKWREDKRANGKGNGKSNVSETHSETVMETVRETPVETGFIDVSEPVLKPEKKGQGQGQGIKTLSGGADKPAPNGTRLPDDWNPGPDGAKFARDIGLEPTRTFDRFADYWRAKPGAAGRKLDWMGTWRNWCRKEAEDRGTLPLAPVAPSPSNPGGHAITRMAGGF